MIKKLYILLIKLFIFSIIVCELEEIIASPIIESEDGEEEHQ